MKDIKSYVIGFLSCACLFLIMGQTDGEEIMEWNVDGKVIIESNENGRYQAFTHVVLLKEHIRLLDTTNGQVYKRKVQGGKWVETTYKF